MSINEVDVKNDSDNDLGDDFDYQPNVEDDAEDDDVDSLDSTSKSEEVCGVKRIADLMVEDIWNLEFRTEDEACQFYNTYSCWHGFVMRKDDMVRDNQGRIISRQLVCNKEGWRNVRYLDLDDRSREARSLTRTKCPARLRVKLDYGYAILDKHNLVGSTWMEKTYETRAMWSHCFLRDKFFGYIRTTSQYEGINSLIRFYVNRKNTLIDFMHNLDRALKEYRNNELIADFKSQLSEPVMITSLEVYERSASCYFTRNIFKEIRNEIQRAGALNIKVLSTTLDKVEFSVTALGDPAKDRRVEVDRGKNLFSCSCKMFESRGIPCSHVFCAMKFENILEFPDLLIYKRWTKNAKNEFIITEMPVNDDIERVLKFRVGALASNCNKLCDIACKDLADFDEVQSELVNLVIHLQSRKQGKSTPNVNVEGINDPFVVKSKGAPSKRSSWRKKRACSNCHKYSHYYKRCPDLMQHSVEGKPHNRSDGNASAKDSVFSPERFGNSSRSISVKSEHHLGPKTKPFKKGGTRKFTATGMRNRKGKDNTFDERSLHESSESIDIVSTNGFFNKNVYLLTQVKEPQQDKRHSFMNYECVNDVIDEKCDTPHVQIDVRDPLPSSLPCGNKQGSYMALFASMHRTL
ncbi:hypothetical protein Ahy_A09g043905 [Arachis hypogaea]|uniref:SWIM-type domain-containing protein n=1 Tax=Arachis hypogaea TaxID=3818 RepID=A0A445BJ84_ARAHY|nr:hypothetical protein Ahy_A09g043905 [Arachis hypogaea]